MTDQDVPIGSQRRLGPDRLWVALTVAGGDDTAEEWCVIGLDHPAFPARASTIDAMDAAARGAILAAGGTPLSDRFYDMELRWVGPTDQGAPGGSEDLPGAPG